MSKIFVSYNRSSQSIVKNLAADIESLGHTPWFDQDLSGGQSWWDQILSTIRDCSVFVFVLSPEALNSTACKREYTYAAALGKPILPVQVSEGVSVNLLPPALSQIEIVNYTKQDREAALRLARALNTMPAPAPLPDPLPKAPKAPISYLGELTEQVDAASLNYQEQAALLADLRRSLRDSENMTDGRTLLQTFRRRPDLFASVRDDIDELLNTAVKPPTMPPDIPVKSPAQPPTTNSQYFHPQPVSAYPAVSKEERVLSTLPSGKIPEFLEVAVSSEETKRSEKWRGALEGAALGFGMGIVLSFLALGSLTGALISSIGCALAGAIAGVITNTRRDRVLAIAVGVFLAVIVAKVLGGGIGYFLPVVFPPLAALAVNFFFGRKSVPE